MFVFPSAIRSHSLLDQKINNILTLSHDHVVLMAVQSIIQNMLSSEDSSQQQLNFVHSCGFGGLWRFAGPFIKVTSEFSTCVWRLVCKIQTFFCSLQLEMIPERDDICHLFINYLETLIIKNMPPDDPGASGSAFAGLQPRSGAVCSAGTVLSSSLSSLTIGSPTDKGGTTGRTK